MLKSSQLIQLSQVESIYRVIQVNMKSSHTKLTQSRLLAVMQILLKAVNSDYCSDCHCDIITNIEAAVKTVAHITYTVLVETLNHSLSIYLFSVTKYQFDSSLKNTCLF